MREILFDAMGLLRHMLLLLLCGQAASLIVPATAAVRSVRTASPVMKKCRGSGTEVSA